LGLLFGIQNHQHSIPSYADLKALPSSKNLIDDLVAGIEQILKGKLVGREEKTFAGNGLCCDFGLCSVVYSSGRL
jgi:hypothetical protein